MTTTATLTWHVERIGHEAEPVLVIDQFVPAPEGLRALAEAGDYQPLPGHYPGLRAPVPAAAVAAFLAPIGTLIAQVFDLSAPPALVEAWFSLVTTPPAALTPIQRLPHFDGLDRNRLALLHFLGPAELGGTAFYRHRTTGWETVDAGRYRQYDAALRADVARHGLPGPDYIRGDTPLFEQIARQPAVLNRALVYRGHLLHCADLPAGATFPADPRHGRLTVNTFLAGT